MEVLVAEVDLPATDCSPGQARALVAQLLRAWGHEEDVDVAVLLTSELVSNAACRAARPVRVSLSATGDGVRLGVSDDDEGLPVVRRPPPDLEGGRGLQIVETLASRWGVDDVPEGKRVWCELPSNGSEPEVADRVVAPRG